MPWIQLFCETDWYHWAYENGVIQLAHWCPSKVQVKPSNLVHYYESDWRIFR